MIDTLQGVFTLTDVKTKTESETDTKWVVWDCVEVFILIERDTLTDVNGFQTHFIGLNLGIGICLCQCERTISLILALKSPTMSRLFTIPIAQQRTREASKYNWCKFTLRKIGTDFLRIQFFLVNLRCFVQSFFTD